MTDSFYLNRQEVINARLQLIHDNGFYSLLSDNYSMHDQISCIGVNWEIYPLELVIEILECFKGPALSSIMRLFAEDYRHHRSGMPDLIIWKDCRYKLIEVKGPNDRLSDAQRCWHSLFLREGIKMEVCHVSFGKIDMQKSDCQKDMTELVETS